MNLKYGKLCIKLPISQGDWKETMNINRYKNLSPRWHGRYGDREIRGQIVPGICLCGDKSPKTVDLQAFDGFVPASVLGIWGQTEMRILSPYSHFVPVCPQNRKIGDKMDPLRTPVKQGFSDRLSPPSKYGDKWKMPETVDLQGFEGICPRICPRAEKNP